jgi:hypothetical protein
MNWTAIIAAVVSVGSMVSVATGHPAIGAIISNPEVANSLTGIVGGIGALVSAFQPAVHAPVASK